MLIVAVTEAHAHASCSRSDIELAIGALRSRAEGFDFDARMCADIEESTLLQRNAVSLRAVADSLLFSLPKGA